MSRHTLSLLCALALVAASCSGGEEETGPTTSVPPATSSTPSTSSAPATTEGAPEDDDAAPEAPPEPDPLASTVTSLRIDPETGDPVEMEEVVGPGTYEEILEAGIEAGLWDELGGLELLLGHAVGAVPSEEVPGSGYLVTREFTDLLERAHAHSLSGEYPEGELEGIRRWYELAVPGPEIIEMLGVDATGAGLQGSGPAATAARAGVEPVVASSAFLQTADCAPIDPGDFSGWAVVEGCYRVWSESVRGVTVRVFYPAWYEDDEYHSGLPLAAGQALVQSVDTFGGFAPVGDVDAVFSLVDTGESEGTLAVANHDATWGQASRGGPCPVSLFPLGFEVGFENVLAHEVWHCVQREMGFPRGVQSGTKWFREGGAQYFANVVFPYSSWISTFDSRSRTTPLWDMGYEAWVWWQFLGSREGPGGVAELHKAMSDAGDGGRGLMTGRGNQFQRFVIEYVAGAIQGPVEIPPASLLNTPVHRVGKDDTGKELELRTGPFTTVRYAVGYDEELRVFESDDSPEEVQMGMVKGSERFDPDAWREVFPEVRSECEDRAYYVIIATTETPASLTANVKIDRIEEAVCDPCVLGTWSLDLLSFENLIKDNVGDAGGGDFAITDGAYYFAFDDEGKVQEQRDGLTISVTSQGMGLDMVIDSFGTGDYSADGENIDITNLVDLFVDVDVAGFGGAAFDAGELGSVSGSGTYVCTDDDLEITIPEGTVRWVRVDKILEPPLLEGEE